MLRRSFQSKQIDLIKNPYGNPLNEIRGLINIMEIRIDQLIC